MEFNKRKFNIVVVFTVCLICFIIVFSSATISSVSISNTIENTTADSGEKDPVDEEEVPGEETTTIPVTTAPAFNADKKWLCLNYSLNNLTKYNYKMYWDQSVKNPVGTQSVKKSIYVTSGKSYAKTVASGQENFTEYGYVDSETSVITNRNNSGNKIYKYTDFINIFGNCLDDLIYDLNQSTCNITSFNADPLKDYYELSITLKPEAYADYIKTMIESSEYTPTFSSVTLIMKIDKKYGKITSIKSVEKYNIGVLVVGQVSCTSYVTMTFTYKDYSSSDGVKEIKSNLGLN